MTSVGGVDVSRETMEKLEAFVLLVQKWTPKINLISMASLPHIWDRHIVDSAQIYKHSPDNGVWLDIGSGGGFPGVVVSILSQGAGRDHEFTFIESDQRKCAFLRTAARELSLDYTTISKRIEAVAPMTADILSARALTDLDGLLDFAQLHLKPSGVALFPKGESWKKEHEKAQERWSYHEEIITSVTNPAAAVLKIKDIQRV